MFILSSKAAGLALLAQAQLHRDATLSQTSKEKQKSGRRRWGESIIRETPNRSILVLKGLIQVGFFCQTLSPWCPTFLVKGLQSWIGLCAPSSIVTSEELKTVIPPAGALIAGFRWMDVLLDRAHPRQNLRSVHVDVLLSIIHKSVEYFYIL